MKNRVLRSESSRAPLVQRITVDEILAEDIIRFEVCDLKENVFEFLYEIDVWGRGWGVVVKGDAYEMELGLPHPWDQLEEGDVFLLGCFEVVEEEGVPVCFRVNSERRRFLKIDEYDGFRDYVRELYSSVLRRD
jgi:hypothetical protein